MKEELHAKYVMVPEAGGTEIQAYLAEPTSESTRGGVVVIHHMPGFDRATKEITRRFAEIGFNAICPNLYWREAPDAAPDDAAALVRAKGGVPDAQLVNDVAAAAAYLRSLPTSNGNVGVIGYCSGGRQSVLAACNVDVQAVVDCYGAFVTGTPPDGFPLRVTNLVEQLPNLRAPLLGLFGAEDSYPSPEHVVELESLLTEWNKPHKIRTYEEAGHGFFATDRPSYRVAAANAGWIEIEQFFSDLLGV